LGKAHLPHERDDRTVKFNIIQVVEIMSFRAFRFLDRAMDQERIRIILRVHEFLSVEAMIDLTPAPVTAITM
jgi:hypothetical protein